MSMWVIERKNARSKLSAHHCTCSAYKHETIEHVDRTCERFSAMAARRFRFSRTPTRGAPSQTHTSWRRERSQDRIECTSSSCASFRHRALHSQEIDRNAIRGKTRARSSIVYDRTTHTPCNLCTQHSFCGFNRGGERHMVYGIRGSVVIESVYTRDYMTSTLSPRVHFEPLNLAVNCPPWCACIETLIRHVVRLE